MLAAPGVVRAQSPLDAEVVVIGAGAAGIAAARQLVDWDYDVVVLEARDRVGGRAWTRDAVLGMPADIGAAWLHNGRANPLLALSREAELELTPSDYENISVTDGRTPPPGNLDDLRAAFTGIERQIDRAAQSAASGATLADLPLTERMERVALALAALAIGGDPSQVSLADATGLATGEDMLVAGGPGRLLRHLATGLPVRLTHAVAAVDIGAADHVLVSGGFGTLRAGAVVLTVPPAVLARGAIRFTPALPDRKRAALSALVPAEFAKLVLRLPRRIEEAPEFAVDLPMMLAGQGALLHLDPRVPLASVMVAGAQAAALRAAGPEAMATAARDALRHHVGLDAMAMDSHDWAADPFSLGPWALVLPGADTARDDYVEPLEDRLFFAGEAAPGALATTLGGAWQSGLAAADAIWTAS